MPASEFALIDRYFKSLQCEPCPDHVRLGIGDDAAIIKVPDGQQLVTTIDTLVSGRHFPVHTQAADIAYKSLAVNVSDLAAMGASPAYFLLSLTLPDVEQEFLHDFSQGLSEAIREYSIPLVGGDTCKGPLSISIQASGFIPDNQFVPRSGAKPGDRIFVSGALGAAALGLSCLNGSLILDYKQQQTALSALNRPRARIDLIDMLRDYANAALDLSDGLVGDLSHILQQSSVGALLYKDKIPVFDWIKQNDRYDYALGGGDDYELLFTVAEEQVKALNEAAKRLQVSIYEIGVISENGFVMQDNHGRTDLTQYRGFDHFAS